MEAFESKEFIQSPKHGHEQSNRDRKARETWSSQMDFIMVSIGCAVGLGNIWRFPYLCYKNGGGAFLVPYLAALFLVAAPMFILEMSLGQYTSSGVIQAWNIVPLFRGIGYAAHVILGLYSIYYVIVIVWAIYYFYKSLQRDLPWASCGNEWNTERCFVTSMTMNNSMCTNLSLADSLVGGADNCSHVNLTSQKKVDAVVEFWENGVLQMSSGIEEPGEIVPGLAVSLVVAWVLVYVCLCGGIKWTGKVVYFTALVPYVLLTAILVRGLTLEGSLNGIVYYLKPDLSKLGDSSVWMEGTTQVLYSIGIGQGFMFNVGSYNKFHDNCFRNSLIIISINSLTSLYGGLAVFTILGFMAHETGQSIETVVAAGPGLVFQTYPKAASQMPLPPLWSALFFLTIIFVGLDSTFVTVEGFLTNIADWFPHVFYKHRRNRTILTTVHCIVCCALGLSLITQGGVYLFRLVDYYAASGPALLCLCTVEAIVVGWVFGADRFYDAMELMMGRRYMPWMKWCWKYLAPVIVQAIFWFEVVTYKPLRFSATYEYPSWATAVGVLIILSTTMCVPVTVVVQMVRSEGSFMQRWKHLTTPILSAHQLHPDWKDKGYRWYMAEKKTDV